jgi:hypothetical protein
MLPVRHLVNRGESPGEPLPQNQPAPGVSPHREADASSVLVLTDDLNGGFVDQSELYPTVVRRRSILDKSYGDMRARTMSAVDRTLTQIQEIDASIMEADFVLAMLQPRRTGTRRIEWRKNRDGMWYSPCVVKWVATRCGLSRYDRIAPAAVIRTVPFVGLTPGAREMIVETLASVMFLFEIRAKLRDALVGPELTINRFDHRTRSNLARHRRRIANFKAQRLEDRALYHAERDRELIRELELDQVGDR